MSRYWYEDPTELLKDMALIPLSSMSIVDRVNTIARIVIVIAIILLVIGGDWIVFLIAGAVMSIVVGKIEEYRLRGGATEDQL